MFKGDHDFVVIPFLFSRPEAAFYFAVRDSVVLARSGTALYWLPAEGLDHRGADIGGAFDYV